MNQSNAYTPCTFNRNIQCNSQGNCDRCGWNPVVSEKRLEKIKRGNARKQKIGARYG